MGRRGKCEEGQAWEGGGVGRRGKCGEEWCGRRGRCGMRCRGGEGQVRWNPPMNEGVN